MSSAVHVYWLVTRHYSISCGYFFFCLQTVGLTFYVEELVFTQLAPWLRLFGLGFQEAGIVLFVVNQCEDFGGFYDIIWIVMWCGDFCSLQK